MNTVRDRASVQVSEPVDGTRHIRYPEARRAPAEWTRSERVHESLMEAARDALRPGEKLVVISATEIHLVPM